ncbi:MAG: tetratricopeptide repeat protein [Alphaproteobacteria bacterium]|nr:tetratricopeptide repeat protein [Alphaproteobacteria bacterium]
MSTDFQKSLKRIGGVALASVLLASCSQDWSSSDQFKFSDNQNNPYAAGKARMAAGHYGLAVESFRKVLAKEPLSIKALNGLAATYDLLGRFDLAERYYRQALNLDPKSVQSLNNLGYSYYLRGEYGRARGLFERAARIDGGNSVVVGNLASLDQAEMQQQVAAAAKQASKATGGKDETAPSQTPWIERSDRQVQTLVTKPDSAIVKAARDYRVEPRIVHAPKPLIEIATVAPVKIDAMKPPSAPAVAAVDSKPAILKVEPKAPRTKLVIGTEPVEVGATARIVEISIRVGSARVGPDVAASVPASTPETGSTKSIEPESYALIESPAETLPVKPGIAGSGLADLPKLNEDVARDVRAALAKAEAAAWAKSAAPLAAPKDPSPTMAKTPDQVDRPVKIAALAADIEPTRTDPGRGLGKGKLTSKDAADQFAALKKAVRLEISNGAGRLHMAARMRRYLVGHGMSNSRLTNAKSFNNQVSVLYFKPGHMANAKSLRGVLPVPPDLRRNAVLGSDLRLVLGGDLLSFDRGLISKSK